MKNICKSFGPVKANRNINLHVRSGEILGLLGENGAGKTTLMNILFGLYQPDEGMIIINGETVPIHSPRDSMAKGIGMVHQHYMLIENQTVAENVALGFEGLPFFHPLKELSSRLVAFSDQYGLKVDPSKKVWQLSAGEQQRVEIVKNLLRGAELLILDEPTSVLTPQEADDLFSILRQMKAEGKSIIIISHKLDEIMAICDRVTVLRQGETVGAAEVSEVEKVDLANMMIGREMIFDLNRKEIGRGARVLEVSDVHAQGDHGEEAVRGISFEIFQNEIFGIAGVSGNGQRELVEVITGLRKAFKGHVSVDGKEITNRNARFISGAGVTHVPEERHRFAIAPNLQLFDNSVLKKHYRKPFSKLLMMNYKSVKDHAGTLVKDFQVSTPSLKTPMKNLSGGNIQKLVLGREITGDHSLLVASHPTYGLDVGATSYIREQLLVLREKGGAVLLVSEDLEEVFSLCDRVAVIFSGEIMGIVNPREVDIKKVGLMMAGSLRMDGVEGPPAGTEGEQK